MSGKRVPYAVRSCGYGVQVVQVVQTKVQVVQAKV